jgi:hypothetical protein
MEQFTEEVIREWALRLDDGTPDTSDKQKLHVLEHVLAEHVPADVARMQVEALLAEDVDFPSKSDFEDDVRDALEDGDFLTADQPKSDRVLYVLEAGNPDFLRRIRDHVETYFSNLYPDARAELYTTAGNQLDGTESDYPGGMANTVKSDSYMSLWVQLLDEEGNSKGYGFKLSGQGGSPSADDFEAGIAIAYNESQGMEKDEAIRAAGMEPSDVEGIYEPIVDAGRKVIEDLPQMGDSMQQVGGGGGDIDFDVSSKWPNQRKVPKTDMYAGQNYRISLKKSGRSQLMSGGPEETQGVFQAAKEFFEREDSPAKKEVADEVLGIVENKFSKFASDLNISTIKNKLSGMWEEKRMSEIRQLSGSELEDHVTAELRLFNLKARRGNWREDLVEDVAPSTDQFVSWVEQQVRENDEISDVYLKAIEGSINHREIQSRFRQLFEGNPEFLKWCVFEAASGVYKFTGEPNPNAYSAGAANKVLVFDQFEGTLRWQDIDIDWSRQYSGKVSIETSFKGKTKRYTSFRMATITEDVESQPMYQSALTAITEQETNRAADKIAGLREQVLMNEGVMDYVRKAGQSIKAIARKVFEFIQQTVMNTAKRIAGRFIKFVRRAADKGLDALMEFFGYEVEGNADVQIQF